jgi:hypothetical protein
VNIISPSTHQSYQVNSQEQYVYDHLLECVNTCPSQQVLERFNSLFINPKGYDNQKVLQALAVIIGDRNSSLQFPLILNRCCHILINRWQLQTKTQIYVVRLVELFELLPSGSNRAYIKSYSNRMTELVREFYRCDYYKQLKRLATIYEQGKPTFTGQNRESEKKIELVGNLINRYPYLYDHCLLGADSSVEQQQNVYKVKSQLEHKFESRLSKYVTYQIRLTQSKRKLEYQSSIIQPVRNPTLLSEKDFGRSLRQYVGTVENGYTYQDLSRSFIAHTSDIRNYKIFKDDLYEYIIQSIDGRYGKHSFNKRLYNKMQTLYSKYDYKKPDEFLKMRTYSQLFNYLIVESPQNPNHLIFMDMVSNIGATNTIGLLLKLVLVCSKVKPYLEKRFSILFNHYESFTKDGAAWLVRSLEKLNIAFSVNFGNLDMSFLRRIYARR